MLDVRQIVKDILNNPNVLLASDSCAGFPYLSLTSADYSLLAAKDTYEDLANLIKSYSRENKWENPKTCFFDVHPVFADGRAIPGLMGLHLALMLYDQGIAGTAQTLYFDIASKWAKAALITEPKVFAVASWINFNRQDIQDYEYQDEDDEENAAGEDQDIFIKASINLIKGSELLSAHAQAQTDFNSKLFEYHKTQNERKILINELEKYREFIAYDIQKTPSLERSALYLFGMIFCREFGLSYSIFISVINELNLKFDFGLSQDIITYCLRALHYIQELRVDIGEYSQQLLDYKQTDISLVTDDDLEDGESENQPPADGLLALASFSEEPNNYSLVGVNRFYEMLPAIKDEFECRKVIYRLWRELVLCFYGEKLDQDLYDKLRSLTDTHVSKVILDKRLLEFTNYDTQYSAIKMAAYAVYVQTIFDFNILNKQGSAVAEQLFEQLNDPKLTDNQAAAINLLNEKAQKAMIKSIMEDHFKNLNALLIQSIGLIAHHELHKGFDDERLKVIDHESFKQMVIQWYRDNYIKAYLELTTDYEEIYALIKRDADLFASDALVENSMLTEVRCFVNAVYNPYLILDFATNY